MQIRPELLFLGTPLMALISAAVGFILNGYSTKRNELRAKQMNIFYDLMATRAQTLSPRHVEAFNAVPVAFYRHTDIIARWRECYDHLGNSSLTQEIWLIERAKLLSALLVSMASALGYQFTKSDIDAIYSPHAHGAIEADQMTVLQGLAKALNSGALTIRLAPSSPNDNGTS